MDEAVQDYIAAIPATHRPLFDRVHQLVLDEFPDAALVLSYRMPTFTRGRRRLHVGAWKHGISLYGWSSDDDDGFAQRHPDLRTSKGTIRLTPADSASVPDDHLRDLVRSTLG